jgi:FKBP-type peptidyl-prolyl cis-trans isomerase (trigger factor)
LPSVRKMLRVQDGDRVTVDFEGKIDGEVFAGGKAEDFQFIVGDGQMLKEFEEADPWHEVRREQDFPVGISRRLPRPGRGRQDRRFLWLR